MNRKKSLNATGIPKDDLDVIMTALHLKRAAVGKICDVGPQAVSWWRNEESIPNKHLARLAAELIRQLRDRPETEIDSKALKIFIQAKALRSIEGSATKQSLGVYYNPDSALSGLMFNKHEPGGSADCAEALATVSLEQLVAEIENRGWSVQLGLRSKNEK